MASTPSASALSAVLRCRGNIWTRNPSTKRPASSGYSLGLAGGALRDSPAERRRPNQEASRQGERAVAGGRLTVAYKSPRADCKMSREKNFHYPKLSHSTGDDDASSYAPGGVQNALVRLQVTRQLKPHLPAIDECSKIIRMIECDRFAARVCKTVHLKEQISDFPAGVLKVSVTSDAGQRSFVSTGWSALNSTCVSLTALLSEFWFLRLVVSWRSSGTGDAQQQHGLCAEEEKGSKNGALQQADGQINSSSEINSGCGRKVTGDRPD